MKNQYNTKLLFSLVQYHFAGIYPRFWELAKTKKNFAISKRILFLHSKTKNE